MSIDWSKAPEGATHYNVMFASWIKYINEHEVYSSSGELWGRVCNSGLKGDMSVLVKRPDEEVKVSAKWSCEGFPPVGEVCMGFRLPVKEYHECEVIAHLDEMAIVVFGDIKELQWCDQFKPLMTDKEKAVKGFCHDVYGYDEDGGTNETMAEYFYDLGYRKLSDPQ